MPSKTKKPAAKRIGDLQIVPNEKRKFGSDNAYFFVRLQYPSGKEDSHLFTLDQLEVSKRRALKNPEDLLAAGILRDALD